MCVTLTTEPKTKQRSAQWLATPTDVFGRSCGKIAIGTSSYVAFDNGNSKLELICPNGRSYFVDLDAGNCTCQGHRIHGRCKHIPALVALYSQLDQYQAELRTYVERCEAAMDG